MTVLMFPPVVPDAVYRIRSAARSDLYLQWADNGIKTAQLNPDSNIQKWKIEGRPDDVYLIKNVGTGTNMAVKSYSEAGQTKQYLTSDTGDQVFTLEPRGDDFIIGVTANASCVDLANDGNPIIWERNNLRNQRWTLDSVDPLFGQPGNNQTGTNTTPTPSSVPLAAGTYRVKNRATNSELTIWTGHQFENAPVLVFPANGAVHFDSPRMWAVSGSGGGVQLTNSFNVGLGARSLKEGPFISRDVNACKLIPVPGTQYYHIATSLASNARVIMDSNPARTANRPTTMSDYNKDEQRQHWEFNPVR